MPTMSWKFIYAIPILLIWSGCTPKQESESYNLDHNIQFSLEKLSLSLEESYAADAIPRTLEDDGSVYYILETFDWTEGFYPGSLWYAYLLSEENKYKEGAMYFQDKFIEHRLLTSSHDLGFVFNNSFGAGFRITENEAYKKVLLEAGNSLIQRYKPEVGCIQSWNIDKGWQAHRGWKYPVIIDNMMNLEMLFELTRITGDSVYYQIAEKHADKTMKNHLRKDFSSYHVVDYDPETGKVRSRQTAQGYAHESSWARGQAWGLYGFTICYRYTEKPEYLKTAKSIANYIIGHGTLPEDKIPYWDFNAPKIPNEPRDVSAAAIIASALLELDSFCPGEYFTNAMEIIKSLSSPEYNCRSGEAGNFLLKHSVGSIPHNNEIDVPLNYADYYYLESLYRLKNISK